MAEIGNFVGRKVMGALVGISLGLLVGLGVGLPEGESVGVADGEGVGAGEIVGEVVNDKK